MRGPNKKLCAVLIRALETRIFELGLSEFDNIGYGGSFINDTFEIGRNSEMETPFFVFYDTLAITQHDVLLGSLVVTAYKYWGRGMDISRECSVEELLEIFTKCFESLKE